MTQDTINKKIVIMGDLAVGKTSLTMRYLGKGFIREYKPTIGANFATKIYSKNNEKVRVMIIDMAGQENFQMLRERYFVGTAGVILVFDVTRPFSAENQIKPWVKEVLNYTKNNPLPLVILANKIDLGLLRQSQTFEGINAAAGVKSRVKSNMPIQYFETSAKDGTGVQQAFEWLMETIMKEK